MTTGMEPTQLSINDRWLMDAQIERLPVFVDISNKKATNLNPAAEPFVPNTPPSRPLQYNEESMINESQELD